MFKVLTKKVLAVSIVVIMMTTLLAGCSKGSKSETVAKVNGEKITRERYEARLNYNKAMLVLNGGKEALSKEVQKGVTQAEALKTQSMDQTTQVEMFLQEAKKRDIKVKEEKVDESLKAFKESLKGKNIKIENFYKDNKITEAQLKELIKESLIINELGVKMQEEAQKSVDKMSDKELEAYFNKNKDSLSKVRASHILVATKEEAEEISKEIKSGKPFEDFLDKSTDEAAKAQNGDLGFFAKGAMVKEFSDKAFSMKKGEVSGPVKTQFGYHIIKVTDVQKNFKDLDKKELKAQIVESKLKEAVEKIEKNTEIKVLIDLPKLKDETTK